MQSLIDLKYWFLWCWLGNKLQILAWFGSHGAENLFLVYCISVCIWLSVKRCTCKGLCTSVENKTLLKTVFIWNVVLWTCTNEWIYSTDNFSNQAVVDFKIQSSHTEKVPKNDCQKRTSMYRVIFVTLLTNKSQAHGETITDLYAENIVLYR